MPVAEDLAYFDHAAVAPLSGPAHDAIATWADEAATRGEAAWASWSGRLQQVRHTAAAMVAAEPEEIALVPNTTTGISLVAEGFPWQRGDNVVVPADEFPSNLYPWMNLAQRGVETRRVNVEDGRLDLDRLADACDGRTRIIAASWVGYASGWRNDPAELARVAHDHGALLFLDAIQALGVFPLDVRAAGVDFFAADGHKWLLGPEGAGLMMIRREHLGRLRPLVVGWNSVVHDHDFSRIELTLKDSAARYEGGSQNMAGMHALGASLDLLTGIGIANVAARLLEVTGRLCERLGEIGARVASDRTGERRSGIVSVDLPGRDLAALRRHAMSRGVVLNHRGGRLRLSPHAYTSEADIARLIEVLRGGA